MKKDNIKFDLLSGLVILKCNLNGEECLFALDTGAKRTSLNSKYRKDFEENKIESNIGAVMYVSNTEDEIISSLIIGNQKHENINAVVFDLSYVEKAMAAKLGYEINIHGVIGYDILKTWNFMIDYQKAEIVFDYIINEQNYYKYKFELSEHLIIIKGNINNRALNFIFDTGANGSLLEEKFFDELINNHCLIEPQKNNYKVGNIEINVLSGILKSMKIYNEIEYVNMPFKFQNLNPFNKNPALEIHGLVGYTIVNNRKIVLDYKNQLIYFER